MSAVFDRTTNRNSSGSPSRRARPLREFLSATAPLRLGAVIAVAAALPVLAACGGDSATGPGGTANYRVQLAQIDGTGSAALASGGVEDAGVRAARLSQDAVEAVELTLIAVEVFRLNADTTGSDTTQGPDARWLRLPVQSDTASDADSVVLDLTELPDTSGVTVAADELEPGTYRGLRLRFEGARIVLADTVRLGSGSGSDGKTFPPGTYDLFVPSGVQTGVKLPEVRFTITADDMETTTVLADTEASIQNINVTGRGLLMTPVLKVPGTDEGG